jgi:hypothetical protein
MKLHSLIPAVVVAGAVIFGVYGEDTLWSLRHPIIAIDLLSKPNNGNNIQKIAWLISHADDVAVIIYDPPPSLARTLAQDPDWRNLPREPRQQGFVTLAPSKQEATTTTCPPENRLLDGACSNP